MDTEIRTRLLHRYAQWGYVATSPFVNWTQVIPSLAQCQPNDLSWRTVPKDTEDMVFRVSSIWITSPPDVDMMGALYKVMQDDLEKCQNTIFGISSIISNIVLKFLRNSDGYQIPPVKPPARDPLGLEGTPDGTPWQGMSDDYYRQCSSLEIYDRYMMWVSSYGSRMDPATYQTESSSLQSYTTRIGQMLTLVSSIDPQEVLHFPGDGVGVGSIAAIRLKRKYVSSEPNPIGSLAVRLGIINHNYGMLEHLTQYPGGVVVASNLSQFVDLPSLLRGRQFVSMDVANPRITGAGVLDEDGVLISNTDKIWNTDRVVLPRPNIPDFSNIRQEHLAPLENDLVMNTVLERHNRKAIIGVPVVRNPKGARTGKEYILTQRKLASVPPNGPGQVSVDRGYSNYYEDVRPYYITRDGIVSRGHHRKSPTTILGREYNVPKDYPFVAYTYFNPSRVRYAYSNKAMIRIVVLSVERQLDGSYRLIATRAPYFKPTRRMIYRITSARQSLECRVDMRQMRLHYRQRLKVVVKVSS